MHWNNRYRLSSNVALKQRLKNDSVYLSYPLFGLDLESIQTRILLSFIISLLIILSIQSIEILNAGNKICLENEIDIQCLFRNIVNTLKTDNIEAFSILNISILYILNYKDRKKSEHYEAWQVIDNAQGCVNSYARIRALENLASDGVPLCGIKLQGADLSKIDLSNADLSGADLRNVDLSGATLEGADLQSANLSGANLTNANLRHITLWCEMTNANISGAHFEGAQSVYALKDTINFEQAYLSEKQKKQIRLD